jgi:hypothetical protein
MPDALWVETAFGEGHSDSTLSISLLASRLLRRREASKEMDKVAAPEN